MDNQTDSNEWLRWWDEITKRLFVVSFGTTGKWTTGQAIYHEAIGNRTDTHYTGRGSDTQFSGIYLKLFLSYYSQHIHTARITDDFIVDLFSRITGQGYVQEYFDFSAPSYANWCIDCCRCWCHQHIHRCRSQLQSNINVQWSNAAICSAQWICSATTTTKRGIHCVRLLLQQSRQITVAYLLKQN